jgi:hypothetical protein
VEYSRKSGLRGWPGRTGSAAGTLQDHKPQVKGNAAASRDGSQRTVFTSLAAIVSIVAASGCCLPLLPFVAATGLAGASALLQTARPYFLGASIALIAYGFYQARRTRKCHRRPRLISSVVLWISALLVATSILFPQLMANVAASLLGRWNP